MNSVFEIPPFPGKEDVTKENYKAPNCPNCGERINELCDVCVHCNYIFDNEWKMYFNQPLSKWHLLALFLSLAILPTFYIDELPAGVVWTVVLLIFIIRLRVKIKNTLFDKKQRVIFAGTMLLVLIVWSYYLNIFLNAERDDSSTLKYSQLVETSRSYKSELQSQFSQIQICFDDNDFMKEVELAEVCISDIKIIISKIEQENNLIENVIVFKNNEYDKLDPEYQKWLDYSIAIHKSKEYSETVMALKSYLQAHISYYEFISNNYSEGSYLSVAERTSPKYQELVELISQKRSEHDIAQQNLSSFVEKNYGNEFVRELGL